MPHLSPMSWALVPLIFWALMILLATFLWWTQPAKFPYIHTTPSLSSFTKWNWS
uniref:ATP synthase F0 subunit 8 n=1 Tax=Pseudopotamilla reniformis TaxID=279639 RepID=UPI001FAF20A4|nr:ATP synthase F0 subunit 8 [Pseudopotamilla reniformis]ULD67131.1 ATP synthase F0 subunit 8 [Pseudopotamilla reniformis]